MKMVTHDWQIVCKPFNQWCIHSLLCSPFLAKYSENENPSGVVMLEAAETRSLLHYARCLSLLLLLGFRLERTFPFAKCFPPSYSSLFPFLPFSNSQNFTSFSPPLVFFHFWTKLSLEASNGLLHYILCWLLTVLVREYFLLWLVRRKVWMQVKFFSKHLAKAKNMPWSMKEQFSSFFTAIRIGSGYFVLKVLV